LQKKFKKYIKNHFQYKNNEMQHDTQEGATKKYIKHKKKICRKNEKHFQMKKHKKSTKKSKNIIEEKNFKK
jgi:uncharacterized LabA/DUF88 family protein